MTGYQEILTDPSYRGQIVTMTYPEIGNYGVNAEDVESHSRRWPGSSCARTAACASNFRSQRLAGRLSQQHGVVASRGSTRGPWSAGCARGRDEGRLSTLDLDDASLVAKAKASPGLVGRGVC